jgi:hypothetical protein
MAFETDTSNWSGEGEFTLRLLERLKAVPAVRFVRVEDAPATRSEADYRFMSNEVFVDFATETRRASSRRFGFLPGPLPIAEKVMNLAGLESALTAMPDVGAPDYADDGMLQYLRTERVIPPYQTKGYKLVELVRIYEVGTPSRS